MELENLKELWKKDSEQVPPEISLEKQTEIHSPLQMLRINMETEFWLMVVTLPLLFTGLPAVTSNANIRIIAILVSVLTLLIIIYYYSRFLKLYKLLRKGSINTNYDLFNLKTQLLISKQIYISYYISYIPLAFLLSLIQIDFHFEMEYNLAIFIVSLLVILSLVWFILKYWVYYMYGKYIDVVVNLVDELNGIEVEPKLPKKKSWFERSQSFWINKLGIKGNIINTVIWFVFMYFFSIFFFTVIIVTFIIIGVKLDFIDLPVLQKALNRIP
ncbi:hypothetical protein [Chryseobacterium oryctis]|uniref:Uncharacterized protein n=1 Tax=Chryseobacterium oryctis TaxID=2952618 RepID=A0ABT3HRV9_9FLAO|nr:hypothetical protein [Chryseobacterium oryctis]MCW3162521.1 hypothetical protein [Chryseobacterium oryctis]